MNIYDFWKAVLGQNENEIRKYFQNDAYINWHCTNERFNVELMNLLLLIVNIPVIGRVALKESKR